VTATRKDSGGPSVAGRLETMPLAEERLAIDRRVAETGRVRVRVVTDVEEARVREALRSEAIEVERVAVGRELAAGEAPPGPREEEGGAVLVVPVLEEVLVVEKRLVVKEELRLRRVAASETVEQAIPLRHQRAEVERLSPAAGDDAGAHAAGGRDDNDNTVRQKETPGS
jgi:stress response protein YsnF